MKKNLLIVEDFINFSSYDIVQYPHDSEIMNDIIRPAANKIIKYNTNLILVCNKYLYNIANKFASIKNNYQNMFQEVLVIIDKLEDLNQYIIVKYINYHDIFNQLVRRKLIRNITLNKLHNKFYMAEKELQKQLAERSEFRFTNHLLYEIYFKENFNII